MARAEGALALWNGFMPYYLRSGGHTVAPRPSHSAPRTVPLRCRGLLHQRTLSNKGSCAALQVVMFVALEQLKAMYQRLA
jgi:hypothetical protein